jgi:hypothetical protein
VDWANVSYHGCNRRQNPCGPLGNDGRDLSPLEVMFVPLRQRQPEHELGTAHALRMSKYQVRVAGQQEAGVGVSGRCSFGRLESWPAA